MTKDEAQTAITAIKQARALDKKAENARELGLDYEPVLKDNSNYRYDPPVAEPVAWKWHQAPAKTSWGHDMVVADLAIDKDNTASVYCERDQTAKVEAMLNPPAAPVQEPVAWPAGLIDRIKAAEQRIQDGHSPRRIPADPTDVDLVLAEVRYLLEGKQPPFWIDTTPPAAQRQWVGLTDEEMYLNCPNWLSQEQCKVWIQQIEAKLKEKNT